MAQDARHRQGLQPRVLRGIQEGSRRNGRPDKRVGLPQNHASGKEVRNTPPMDRCTRLRDYRGEER